MKRKWISLLLVAALLLSVMSVFATAMAEDKPIKIGVSLPTAREERWVKDREGFERAAAEAGIDILVAVADNNQAVQRNDVENMLTNEIDVLIIGACDEEGAADIVALAHAQDVPVIAYDREIANADVDLLVTFDQYTIGYLMGEYMAENLESGNIVVLRGCPTDSTCPYLYGGAMDAMKEKLDSGAYKVVAEQDCIDWEPNEAMKHTENALTANNNDIQGVIAPNDGTAGGVIQALAAQGLAGNVIVTGQDSEADAIKRIIEGTQSMTVFGDTGDMSGGAFAAAVKMAKGEEIEGLGTPMNNGFKDVPTLEYPAKKVTLDNYHELLIASGYIDEGDIQ
ncbi:MAG: substrate-binding domain-containing protein [Clostridia bacterium]|nr:substrate-binding domain-containing protein [Clostridia bacterium]